MSKKSLTNSTQTTNGTTNVVQTPTNPAWVDQGLAGIGGNIANLSKLDPYSLIAGPDPLQTQAATGASNLAVSPYMGQGGGMVRSGALAGANTSAGASLLQGLENYMSPYTNDVVNTTLAGYDKNAGYTRAQDTLAKAGDSTFGGSGGAIQSALNEQNISQGRASTEAGLRDQAFTRGAGLSLSDAQLRQQNDQFNAGQQDASANRLLQGGTALAGIGSASDASARANVGAQSDIGAILQQLAQNHATAPLTAAGALTSMWGGLPLGLLHGQDTNGTENSTSTGNSSTTVSDPLGTFGSILGGAGSLATGLGSMGLKFSDRRLKTDIKKVGSLDDGLGVFSYRYKAGGPKEIGVMAQEVAKVNPRAVHNIGGLLAVDYGAI